MSDQRHSSSLILGFYRIKECGASTRLNFVCTFCPHTLLFSRWSHFFWVSNEFVSIYMYMCDVRARRSVGLLTVDCWLPMELNCFLPNISQNDNVNDKKNDNRIAHIQIKQNKRNLLNGQVSKLNGTNGHVMTMNARVRHYRLRFSLALSLSPCLSLIRPKLNDFFNLCCMDFLWIQMFVLMNGTEFLIYIHRNIEHNEDIQNSVHLLDCWLASLLACSLIYLSVRSFVHSLPIALLEWVRVLRASVGWYLFLVLVNGISMCFLRFYLTILLLLLLFFLLINSRKKWVSYTND